MTAEYLIRSAVFSDQHPLSVMLNENLVHRHLDWREPLSWIGTPPFLVLEHHGQVVASLVCPPNPPGIAWLRLFSITTGEDVEKTWEMLWDAVRREFTRDIMVAAIAMQDWMGELLVASGFTTQQELVMLERNDKDLLSEPVLEPGNSIRSMVAHDLPFVADLDAASFIPLWQNTLADLTLAHSRALLASVAEEDGRLVGYQLSTRTSIGIHLARLAVHPGSQGVGNGQALVIDMISHARRRGIQRFTVNTQSDNSISLLLYKKLNFLETGERYPVYTLRIPA